MIITLLIVAYIANIFLCRHINYLLVKADKYNPVVPFIWFLPAVGTIALTVILMEYSKGTWFTGKNWRK